MVMIPNHGLPYIKSSKGNVHYLTKEDLARIIAGAFRKFIHDDG